MDKILETFYEFVQKINKENSRSYKESVLRAYKCDGNIKYLLNFIFNPYVTTGVSDKKVGKVIFTTYSVHSNIIELCEYLKANNTGKDINIAYIQRFIEANAEYAELIKAIVTKNLILGIQIKTLNKVYGNNFIPEFKVQLAFKYFDCPEYVTNKEFTLTNKIDGSRCIVLKHNGKVKFYNRSGKEEEGLVEIQEELEKFNANEFALDCELTLLDSDNLVSKEQYQKTMKVARTKGEKRGLKLKAFDLIPYKQFINCYCDKTYKFRRMKLEQIFKDKLKFVEVLPVLYCGSDINKITEIHKQQTDKGEEGIMININDAPYAFERTKNLLKVKKMDSVECEIIGFKEGTNKYSDTLGAIVVNYKNNNVDVGSGFTDEQRDLIWKNKDKYIGKVVEVQYFEETKNQNGGISLRFPVFKDFRFDKEADN